MDTWLMITDITGKQYPHKVTEEGIRVEGFVVTPDNYNLDGIQNLLETYDTIRVQNRVFRTQHLIEVSVVQYPAGAA
jgi:hypothetical protein